MNWTFLTASAVHKTDTVLVQKIPKRRGLIIHANTSPISFENKTLGTLGIIKNKLQIVLPEAFVQVNRRQAVPDEHVF